MPLHSSTPRTCADFAFLTISSFFTTVPTASQKSALKYSASGDIFSENLFKAVQADPERQPLCLSPVNKPDQTPSLNSLGANHDIVGHEIPMSDNPRQSLNPLQFPRHSPRNSSKLSRQPLHHNLQPPPQAPADFAPDNSLPVPSPFPRLRKHFRQIPHNLHPPLRHIEGTYLPQIRQRNTVNPLNSIPTQLSLPAIGHLQPCQHPQILDFGNNTERKQNLPRLRADADVNTMPPRPKLHQPPILASFPAAGLINTSGTATALPLHFASRIPPSRVRGSGEEQERVRTVSLKRRRDDFMPGEPCDCEFVRAGDGGATQAAS
ncbi:uncharacterized protein CTRU02_212693 [Colletotrichum truncatum]|uniref:Uncharacterized protein n=1 Tax=Colletotrichum truncatum TaxID=5467 RepID=A0ACC3YIL7_COLTU